MQKTAPAGLLQNAGMMAFQVPETSGFRRVCKGISGQGCKSGINHRNPTRFQLRTDANQGETGEVM
jgi:hypothetical protein